MDGNTRTEGLRLLNFIAALAEERQPKHGQEHHTPDVGQQNAGFSPMATTVLRKMVPHLALDNPIGPSLNWWS